MPRSRPKTALQRWLPDSLTSWRTWANVGSLLFLGWFLLLLGRPQLVRQGQRFLLHNRQLITYLPHGIATPRIAGETLTLLGIPVAYIVLLVSLAFAWPEDDPGEASESD